MISTKTSLNPQTRDQKSLETKNLNQKLLNLEVVIGFASLLAFFAIIITSSLAFSNSDYEVGAILMAIGIIFFVAMALIMLRIEQLVGYYLCGRCHHKYIPKYSSVLWGAHFGRTRYIKCPKCHQWSWQKKVL
ncbi:MAG: hypothetical protein Q4A79_01170 [Candidatus Saccharibacteria bacterium]|nr:hypothetical protein [Candidatus Saccharibacteria bacterium]